MYQRKTYEIKSCDDEELGIKRDSLLEFKVSFDDEKEMKALFFFINGIRDSEYASYEEHLAEFVVKEFGVAVICVEYHCIGLRSQLGAKFYFDLIDYTILQQSCQTLGIAVPENIVIDKNMSGKELDVLIFYLQREIEKLTKSWSFDPEKKLTFCASFRPTKNEYQNFGLMQALDILNALCFVKNNPPFKLAKDYKSLLFGTSHGGYIAFLAAKFAPWLIDAVVENSGYVSAIFRLLGFGKELDYEKITESAVETENVVFAFNTKTHWTSDKKSKYYFSEAHNKIRSASEHLQTQSKHHKPLYISYHSINDDLALPQEKIKLYEKLVNLGFEARLHMIKDKSEVDGEFIKNLNHGMDMSLKTLIQKELPPLLARTFKRDKKEKKHITYVSEDLEYHFEEKEGGVRLKISKTKSAQML